MRKIFAFIFICVFCLNLSSSWAQPEVLESEFSRTCVPTRDVGICLDTFIYFPSPRQASMPVILLRSPYLKAFKNMLVESWLPFTRENGYVFVLQSVRGTGESKGVLDPVIQEFDDGRDTVKWISKQKWSNRKIGTVGSSYDGMTAFAAAYLAPGESASEGQVSAVIADGYPMYGFSSWPWSQGGIPNYGSLWWWRVVEKGDVSAIGNSEMENKATNARPVAKLDEILFGETISGWKKWAQNSNRQSEYWNSRSLSEKIGTICTPALHLQAKNEWVDDPIQGYKTILKGPCPDAIKKQQRLILGEHDHGGAIMSPMAKDQVGEIIRNYLHLYLKSESSVPNQQKDPVLYYTQGAGQWKSSLSWPPKPIGASNFYLQGTQRLAEDGTNLQGIGSKHTTFTAENGLTNLPPTTDSVQSYTFDPDRDNAARDAFENVVYRSLPLQSGITIVGRMRSSLYVSLDQLDTDLFLKVVEERPDGQFRLLRSAGLRLRYRQSFARPQNFPVGETELVNIEFSAIANHVAAGSRLMLVISSTEAAAFENQNLGIDEAQSPTLAKPVTVKIFSGPDRPSVLTLPVIL